MADTNNVNNVNNVNNINNEVNKELTEQINDIVIYAAQLQKAYTDKKVNEAVTKSSIETDKKLKAYEVELEEKIGKTRDELAALVSSLDNIDFVEDGKIDASVLTKKIADLDSSIEIMKNNIDKLNKNLEDKINTLKTNTESSIDEINSSVEDRIKTLENKVALHDKEFQRVDTDIFEIREDLDKSVFKEDEENTEENTEENNTSMKSSIK
jgi:uncharacterized coiled-coil protein SlyX